MLHLGAGSTGYGSSGSLYTSQPLTRNPEGLVQLLFISYVLRVEMPVLQSATVDDRCFCSQLHLLKLGQFSAAQAEADGRFLASAQFNG